VLLVDGTLGPTQATLASAGSGSDVCLDLDAIAIKPRSRASSTMTVNAHALLTPNYVLQHGDALIVRPHDCPSGPRPTFASPGARSAHARRISRRDGESHTARPPCASLHASLQIEAYQSLLRKHKHSNHFSLAREVPDSQPPRTTELMDQCVAGPCATPAPRSSLFCPTRHLPLPRHDDKPLLGVRRVRISRPLALGPPPSLGCCGAGCAWCTAASCC
jgi:hypothetical protein